MRNLSVLLVLAGCAAVAGCTNAELQTACVIDGVAQPIVVTVGTVAAGFAGADDAALATQAASADNKAHAAVQGACGALGGTAVVNNTAAPTVTVTTNAGTAAAVAAQATK